MSRYVSVRRTTLNEMVGEITELPPNAKRLKLLADLVATLSRIPSAPEAEEAQTAPGAETTTVKL